MLYCYIISPQEVYIYMNNLSRIFGIQVDEAQAGIYERQNPALK